jgi:HSP20 family protein
MAGVRLEPLRELAALQSEMSGFMNQVYGTAGAGAGQGPATWLPPLDVSESEAEIVLAGDLPRIHEDEVSIEVDDGVLTVSGERTRERSKRSPTASIASSGGSARSPGA